MFKYTVDEMDLDLLIMGFENSSYSSWYYFDKKTAQIIFLSEENRNITEDLDYLSKFIDLKELQIDLDEALDSEIYEYVLELLDTEQFLRIAPNPSFEAYNLMEQFVENLEDGTLKDKLLISLNGKGAFRRFKDTLYLDPNVQRDWFDFEYNDTIRRIKKWAADNCIEIQNFDVDKSMKRT